MRTDNPIADAHNHFNNEKSIPPNHKCLWCETMFYPGQGVEIAGEEKFCEDCIEHNHHLTFYRSLGITAKEIELCINQIKQL